MGKSYSTSVSTAIDNRLAVTDNAFGLSSSGSGNNTTLDGHIFNVQANSSAPGAYKGGAGGTPGGGTVSINVLDGGAIDKAFDFSAFSLSKMLDSIITGQKINQDTAQYTADTIGTALTQTAQVNAAAAAAAKAAEAELQGDKMATYKKWLLWGGLAVGGYLIWKGKK